jgi:hypothetical protein
MQAEHYESADSGNRTLAVLAGALLLALALIAHLGRLAESPAAARVPGLAMIGAGKAGQLRGLILDANGLPPAGSQSIAREALAGAPLAYEPFFVAAAAGFREVKSNGSAADAALLGEALRRNPRAREAHFLMLRHAVGTGNLTQAIEELAVMNRLTGGIADKLMPAVGMAVRDVRQASDAAAALGPHPELLESFLKGFAQSPKGPDVSIALVTRLPRTALFDPEVRDAAIAELVHAQAFTEARALWGAGIGGGNGLVHSADFADSIASPPFNWALQENTSGVAERAKGGGLSVDYYGRVPGPLVSQLLTMPPGRFKAHIEYRTESGSPDALGLQLQCVGNDSLIFVQPLSAKPGLLQVLTVTFSVPVAGCKGQYLTVAGRVQESRDPQAVWVRRLDVAPAEKQ